MLGHKIVQQLSARFEVVGVARSLDAQMCRFSELTGARIVGGLFVDDDRHMMGMLAEESPDVVINCVGVVKQRGLRTTLDELVQVNALFPHELSRQCAALGARLIHVSTDCVFSGVRGNYEEPDRADPVDSYGMSKLLGEVHAPHVVTIRTSMIGRELRGLYSLLEWLLRHGHDRRVPGFSSAVFSGLTNLALAREIGRLIADHPQISGLFHISADPINKYQLLLMLKEAFCLPVEVYPDPQTVLDRSLRSDSYRAATGFQPMSWKAMVEELAVDATPYAELQDLARQEAFRYRDTLDSGPLR
jgi:dTDP-4-dehydrorhamnose reductase